MPQAALFLILLAFVLWMLPFGAVLAGTLQCDRPAGIRVPRIAIIVAAHNEAASLPCCLNALLCQDYPRERYQIILADDRSTDGTPQIIARFVSPAEPRVQYLRIDRTPTGWQPKKYALHLAARHADAELLFFTDADCIPGPSWLSSMASYFGEGIDAVIGFAPLAPLENEIIGRLAQIESIAAGLTAAGGVGLKKPFLAMGRNLAVRRRPYVGAAPHKNYQSVASGDDDLLVQQLFWKKGHRVAFARSAQSHVASHAPGSLKKWLRQRRRHLATAPHYPIVVRLGYLAYYLGGAMLFILPLILAIRGVNYAPLLLPGLLRLLLERNSLQAFARNANIRVGWADYLLWLVTMPVLSLIAFCSRQGAKTAWGSVRSDE